MLLTSILIAGAMTPAVTVQQGDTYKSIAQKNNVSIAQLEQANNKEIGGFDLIFPDETVVLPKTSQEATQATNVQSNITNNEQQTNGTEGQNIASNVTQTVGTFKCTFYDVNVASGGNTNLVNDNTVAVDYNVIPYGSSIKITLSSGEVLYRTALDTGSFKYSNSYQIDIGMSNSQIFSQGRGVDTATVEIIG